MSPAAWRLWDWLVDGDGLPVRDLARAVRRAVKRDEDGVAPDEHLLEVSSERLETLAPWLEALVRGLARVASEASATGGLRIATPRIELRSAPDLEGRELRIESRHRAPASEAVVGGPTQLPGSVARPARQEVDVPDVPSPADYETELDPSSEPAPGLVTLRIESGPESGRLLDLPDGALVAGRDAGCDLVLVDETRKLSRRHALLRVVGGALRVEDLSSRNGIRINDVRVPSGELLDGQRLQLGGVSLRRVPPAGVDHA